MKLFNGYEKYENFVNVCEGVESVEKAVVSVKEI